jgi:DNA-binding response OmpR family regulator
MPVPPIPTQHSQPSRGFHTRSNALRIFICDDDFSFSVELAEFLTSSGFEVRTLRDGKSPIEIFELFRPDIVFLDIYMPPPDGFEIMNHIAQDTRQRDITVILMSGATDSVLEVARRFCQAREIKAAAVLSKPIRLADVIKICKEHPRAAPAQVGDI